MDENDGEQGNVRKENSNLMVVSVTTLMQPFILGRTLMQVGYEPLQPVLGKSIILRHSAFYYPNIIQYLNHIRKANGSLVLFTGLTPKLCNVFLFTATEKTVDALIRSTLPYKGKDAELTADQKGLSATAYEIAVNCVAKSAGLIITQPLHVVMVRMICAVVTKDEPYQGIISTIKEIYNSEGLAGFFSGLVPRWLAEMIVVSLGGSLMFGLYRIMTVCEVTEPAVRTNGNYNALLQFMLSSFVYKYQLVSTVTSASCSGLHIGLPGYSSWSECFRDLSSKNQLGRGSSYFLRKVVA